MQSGILSAIKCKLLPKGSRPRVVALGLYRGLKFRIDFHSQTQLYLGLWERETYSYIYKAARRAVWAVDIGAGRGELVVYLLLRSEAKKVYAIEPEQTEINAIYDHLGINGLPNDKQVAVVKKFVGTSAREDYLALDDLDVDLDKQGFVKIDVDGAEFDVLDSGRKILSRGKLDMLIETHSADLEKQCIQV